MQVPASRVGNGRLGTVEAVLATKNCRWQLSLAPTLPRIFSAGIFCVSNGALERRITPR